jgi:hypothetical protein
MEHREEAPGMVITLEILISGLSLVGAAVLWHRKGLRPLSLLLGAVVTGFWCFFSTLIAAMATPGVMEPGSGSSGAALGSGILAVVCGLACLGAFGGALYLFVGQIVRAVRRGHSQAGR